MATLKKTKVGTEKELHEVIEKELDALEEGLCLLKYEFGLEKARPDFLCVDSGGRIVIIEVKLGEDENVLFQALGYYSIIDQERYVIAKMFQDSQVDPKEHPRIVLVAKRFSDYLRRLTVLVVPDVEIYEYSLLQTPESKTGVCFHSVTSPKLEVEPSKPSSVDSLREYIRDDELRMLFSKLIPEVESIGEGIESYATQNYVGFKFKGRMVAWLSPYRKSVELGAVAIDENGRSVENVPVRLDADTQDYAHILERTGKSFLNLGGKMPLGHHQADDQGHRPND